MEIKSKIKKKFFFIKVYLIYNVVLVTGVQKNDSAVCVCAYIYLYIDTCVYSMFICVCACIYIDVCTHMHSYMHTYAGE